MGRSSGKTNHSQVQKKKQQTSSSGPLPRSWESRSEWRQRKLKEIAEQRTHILSIKPRTRFVHHWRGGNKIPLRDSLVPIEPFHLWLQNKLQSLGIAKVAASVGVTTGRIKELLKQGDQINIEVVDKFMIAFEEHPRDLYREDY